MEYLKVAIKEGAKIRGFMSGGGLRVLRLEVNDELKGYGEHPDVEIAWKYLEEDYRAGGRPYHEVYGKLHDHYLTGSSTPTTELDAWLRQGSKFQVEYDDRFQKIAAVLEGYQHADSFPKFVTEAIDKGVTWVEWKQRGFGHVTTPTRLPNGDRAYSTKTISFPDDKPKHRAMFYRIAKTGYGDTIKEAIDNAFNAEPVEVDD